ncbi:phosphoribosylformylglycinamidine cyclo-ligase [Desulfoscipio geothermicus]|uniref:Phosphoribosylformylglycinamidine cyclo-ligase n=1 Tax=Desulfoscipio geothermicus DSM 3669 TaxID=1121426 RepID=A0A1I6CVM8_9FIRM|nr:phosphoribosylformylglycinamidine cyclo-ligase [Desulfoscipio geothermicus]SFQ97220.1 phosphoribosylformylglycinamidine cyclo-ligase [Desulfoscipio geothermicus DSM 3669]
MPKQRNLTYADTGVDIDAGNRAVELMKKSVRSTFRPGVLTGIGGFGGLFALDTTRYREPVLVSGTDGVGTKLRVAFLTGKHDTIGIDAVAMCVNDILTLGAEPLFFLDYLAVGKLEPEKVADIVSGVAEGCRQAGCALIGGETAEMPDFYETGEYDIAGFAVGVAEKSKIIDGSAIVPGDVLIGLSSSGLHSNGYSLARRVLLDRAGYRVDQVHPALGRTVGEELLCPTRIYVPTVLPLLQKFHIKGIAHITGGGLPENVPRVLPPGTAAQIDTDAWETPPVFKIIAEEGPVETTEMYRVFNMGIGMVLVVPESQAGDVINELHGHGENACPIGRVIAGNGKVELI